MLTIRRAETADFAAIWPIFYRVVGEGTTYAFAPDTSREEAQCLWMGPGLHTYVALEDERVVGTYFFKANQPGLGAHVANAGYMVDPDGNRRGVGRAMGEHSLQEAKQQGFKALQFNFVVSTNERAVRLWQALGFQIVGTVPQAFQHRTLGLVDVYIMHRFL
ncbi:Ribosomal protein S18 acetylase RimI [Catalinimonas alkaloidigena]|uniref:Ribosomal protein S18 acetylase RimI n=1 Tax=Catalinimonas alkaloidigena TaxID=1075417 RepID=A0A1G9L119_9BACT|nr:GNAT family N-acetyltransferase [Catalinimonas alkaloidigena]SDL55275.1 Ribosomal protein S18 acetylase RimI [Catalinimonas alkaloidigena]